MEGSQEIESREQIVNPNSPAAKRFGVRNSPDHIDTVQFLLAPTNQERADSDWHVGERTTAKDDCASRVDTSEHARFDRVLIKNASQLSRHMVRAVPIIFTVTAISTIAVGPKPTPRFAVNKAGDQIQFKAPSTPRQIDFRSLTIPNSAKSIKGVTTTTAPPIVALASPKNLAAASITSTSTTSSITPSTTARVTTTTAIAASPTTIPITVATTSTTLAPVISTASLASNPVRAMWLWQSSVIGSNPTGIISFANANEINKIYLQISGAVPYSTYASFISSAAASGISVAALGGSSDWGTDPTHAGINQYFNWVETYNASVAQGQRFGELSVDIEPYSLPEWQSNQTAVAQSWMANMAYLQNLANNNGFTLTATLPFWLNQIAAPGTTESLGQWIIDHSNATAIMAYRSSLQGSNGILAIATPLLNAAAASGHKAIVAIDTTPTLSTSFSSKASLSEAIQQFFPTFSSIASYGGYAVNDYSNWNQLP